jgi:TP901 family phage tail tape measure protein
MATNTEKIVVQVVVKGQGDLEKLNQGTKKATGGVGALVKQYGLLTAGIAGAVQAFRTINKFIGQSVKSFRDFEFQMAKVKAITGASTNDFLKLSKTAEDLGRSTFFTAQQVAELQTNFGKLGFTTQEILNAQEATLQLATATDTDLGRAAIVAGAAVRGFGLNAAETQRVVDVMAVSFTSSALDIEKFQTSMTKVAPIAKAAGFSIEDTTAIMAQLSDAGIEASIAGTSLRNILLKMQDPNSDLVKSFGKTIHSLDELVPALTKFSAEGGSLAEIMEVVDLRQAAAFEQMITSKERTVQLRDALKDANGAAEEMANIVGDTLEGSFKRFNSAMQGLMINIVDSFVGKSLQKMVDGFANLINVVSDFVDIPMSEKLADEKHEMNLLFEVLKDTTNSQETRNKAINQLNIKYNSYLPNLISEKDTIKELSEHQFNANQQMAEKIKMMGAQERLNEIQKQGQKIGQQIFDETVKLRDLEEDMGTSREQFVTDFQTGVQTSLTGASILTTKNNLTELNKEFVKYQDAYADAIKVAEEFGIVVDKNNEVVTNSNNTTVESTNAIIDNNDAKQKRNDVDREYLEFQIRQMGLGLTTEQENADIRKKLIQQEIDDLRELLSVQVGYGIDREAILQRVFNLEQKLSAESSKDKDKRLQEDIARAALQGQSAIESVKSVIRARVMEAVATEISQVIKSVPFPANLIIAGGMGYIVSSLFDQAMAQIPDKFANGGMVHGRSHAQGGEKFAVGGRVVELEGGEAVINKRSTAMFRNQLSAMNAAGGGVKFADGGLMNMPSFAQSQFNATSQAGMMGAIGQGGKVVVVESDISQVQNTVSVIEAEATF